MSDNADGTKTEDQMESTRREVGDLNLAESSSVSQIPNHLEDYQIDKVIGEGGMGTVYKATHVRLKRTVALKVLAPHLLDDPEALSRFRREIEAVGNLPPHQNVVLATDARQSGQTHFLVMEFVDGCDLGELIRRRGPLRVGDACEIIRQATVGLDHIASHGLVHRDLKPTNLLLTAEGVVKILDLGLARFVTLDRKADELTQLGQCLGTPDYMAPEQWENSTAVDIAADLYSLGCTLFYLIVGRVPFGGPSHDTVFKKRDAHLREPPPDLQKVRPDAPRELAELVQRLLSKEASDRISSPRLLAERLMPLARQADLRALSITRSGNEAAAWSSALTETETINSVRTAGHSIVDSASQQGTRKRSYRLQGQAKKMVLLGASVGLLVGVGSVTAVLIRQRLTPSIDESPSIVEITSETSLPVPAATDSKNALAKQILESGGTLTVNRDGEELTLTQSQQLDGNPLNLVGMDLSSGDGVTDNMILPLIGGRGLEFLNLQSSSVSQQTLTDILSRSPRMTHLNISGLPLANADLSFLRGMTMLDTLWIGESGIGDEQLGVLAEVQSLQYLWMGGNPITDEGVKKLVALKGLYGLGLEHSRVTGECLPTLATMKLRELILDGTSISDGDVNALTKMTHLQFVSLKETQVTPGGLAKLRELLAECRVSPDVASAGSQQQ